MFEEQAAEDKLATTLYTLQASEKALATNMVETLKTLQDFFQNGFQSLNIVLPAVEAKLRESRQSPVYGEQLSVHLRYKSFLM